MVCEEVQANPEEEIRVSSLLDSLLREVIFPELPGRGRR